MTRKELHKTLELNCQKVQDKEKILKSTRKKCQLTFKEKSIRLIEFSVKRKKRPRGVGKCTLSSKKTIIANHDHFTSQGYFSELKRNKDLSKET
jgi:hypothetical protein